MVSLASPQLAYYYYYYYHYHHHHHHHHHHLLRRRRPTIFGHQLKHALEFFLLLCTTKLYYLTRMFNAIQSGSFQQLQVEDVRSR